MLRVDQTDARRAAARFGAVAGLALKSLKHGGTEYASPFSEKGRKSREIPVRHNPERPLRDYIKADKITEAPSSAPSSGRGAGSSSGR
jgi:hypothetical protein